MVKFNQFPSFYNLRSLTPSGDLSNQRCYQIFYALYCLFVIIPKPIATVFFFQSKKSNYYLDYLKFFYFTKLKLHQIIKLDLLLYFFVLFTKLLKVFEIFLMMMIMTNMMILRVCCQFSFIFLTFPILFLLIKFLINLLFILLDPFFYLIKSLTSWNII